MGSRTIRLLCLASLVCLFVLPLHAAPGAARIEGVVVDPAGTPQMGATVVVSSEQLLDSAATVRLLTNARGRFSTSVLPIGMYSITVTLAGFLPAVEQHIQVDSDHAALLQIVLGSVLSSFEKLRRPADQQVAADDWTWVLRTSAATRSVFRWQDVPDVTQDPDGPQASTVHARLEVTSGADHPGSVSDVADSPGTAFAYGLGVGAKGQVLMAGQFSYQDAASSAGVAAEWLPSGEAGVGPVTTILMRESSLTPGGPVFRGLRVSHDDELSLGNRVSIRYGGEFLMAGFNGTTSTLRPRGEVDVQIASAWRASVIAAARPWQNEMAAGGTLESAVDTLDALPTLLIRDGRPVFEGGLHEEVAVDHTLGKHADISAAAFHDFSRHTAVIGRGGAVDGPDFLQDYFSEAFAYDGGSSSSTGARLAYRQEVTSHLDTTIVYAYAGALAPDGDSAAEALRDELDTRYRHSLAGKVSATVPRFGTNFSASYKWLSGPTVSRLDPYGESVYQIDPYLSMQIRQPLPNVFPCHVEVQADVGNLLAQGYVPIATGDGSVMLIPSYRFFKGGLSLQF
ncbi:MAG TPA: carboxypeptidase-like regulatory domain-containing protein [Candidatus Acidoferrales bacterium]|nr:carboxypeptidase-like regulatory domain-containing protein [Candidatus Acidoferrales bacterium]